MGGFVRLIRNLCWWLPKCGRCWNRDKVLFDELCIDCHVLNCKARIWEAVGQVAARVISEALPTLIESFTGVRRVRRSVRRRNPMTRRRVGRRGLPAAFGTLERIPSTPDHPSPHRDDLRELRKMAGLPELPPSSAQKPTGTEDSGEAKP